MELGESLVWHPELDRRDRALDRVDILPVDVPLRKRDAKVPGEDSKAALEAEPPHQTGGTDIDGHQAQSTVDFVETEVVDSDHLAPVDVDNLLVHQVGPKEDLVGTLLELLDVDTGRRQPSAGCVERSDGTPWQEDRATIGPDDEARHRWVLVLDRDDEVGDLADLLIVSISHWPADRLAQVKHPAPPDRKRTDSRGSRLAG